MKFCIEVMPQDTSKFYILTSYTQYYQRDGRLNFWGGIDVITDDHLRMR
jgi:hypothetical protein